MSLRSFTSRNLATPIWLALAGGAIFLLVFLASYSGIDPHLYEVRDDGVITLSVGRNLADYGFLGVSPSGPRVEASSSPAQTFIYALVYKIAQVPFDGFALDQTRVATFLLGALFIQFFNCLAPSKRPRYLKES